MKGETIILSKDTAAVTLPVGRDALCVRHKAYAPPITKAGCLHLAYEEFRDDHKSALRGRSVMVVVGLSRMATPGNRTKVGPLLWGRLPGVRRISVDRTLFVSEPWRAWWHFGCVGAKYREYTYSYLAESHWRAAQDGVREDDPFSLEAIVECGRGVVRSEYKRFFDPLKVERVELGPKIHRAYAELKETCFEEEHTIKAVMTRLTAFAQTACPRRSIPSTSRLFDATRHAIVQTDLAIDSYLVGRLRELIDLTNGIGSAFHAG